jgi:hypothetical protein
MATAPPQKMRWMARANKPAAVLTDSSVRLVMEKLGYVDDVTTWL